jgi:hypothetical protein
MRPPAARGSSATATRRDSIAGFPSGDLAAAVARKENHLDVYMNLDFTIELFDLVVGLTQTGRRFVVVNRRARRVVVVVRIRRKPADEQSL